jgi:hypothetical protein
MADQALQDPAILGSMSPSKKGPKMVAAEALAFLDQEDRNLRPGARHGKRGQAARQAASRNKQSVALALHHSPLTYNSRLGASYGLCEACFASAILGLPGPSCRLSGSSGRQSTAGRNRATPATL